MVSLFGCESWGPRMAQVMSAPAALVVFFAVVAICGIRTYGRKLQQPPGPRGLPFFGNILDFDIGRPWLSYEKWAKRYGGLMYITLLGQEFIVISTEEIAHELLEKRSSIYSDRPYMLTNELFGLEFNTGLLPYGDEWRLHRRMFNVALGKGSSKQYADVQMQKSHQLLRALLAAPRDYLVHFNTFAAAIIMAITYGYDVVPENDPFVVRVTQFLREITLELTPEKAALLAAMPFLNYIPSWCPGGRYKLRARECRANARWVLDDPLKFVQDTMAAGTAKQSLVRNVLVKEIGKGSKFDREETVKAAAATVFLGGADTTSSTLLVFLLAMVLYPDAQRKAQEEIDRVIGCDRLPEFRDRSTLPYVEAIVFETLRWHPVTPLTLPHKTMADDTYNGLYIPKGIIVLMNAWAMTQNEKRYPDPRTFKPDRFLTPDGKLVDGITLPQFGFGRRICPGRHLASQSLWIVIVSMLATLRIGKAKDEMGLEIDVEPEFATGLSPRLKPFLCSIVPRSEQAEGLIC